MSSLMSFKYLNFRFLALIFFATGVGSTPASADLKTIAENMTASHRRGAPIENFNLVSYDTWRNYGTGIQTSPLYPDRGFGKFVFPAPYNPMGLGSTVTLDIDTANPQIRGYLESRHGPLIPREGAGALDYKVSFMKASAFQIYPNFDTDTFNEGDRLVLRPQHRLYNEEEGPHDAGWTFKASMVGSQQGFSLIGNPGENYGATVHLENGELDPTTFGSYVLSASGRGAGMIARFGDPAFFQNPEAVAGIRDTWSIATQLQHPGHPDDHLTSVTDIHIVPDEIIDWAFLLINEDTKALNFFDFMNRIWDNLAPQSQASLSIFDRPMDAPIDRGLLDHIQDFDLRSRILPAAGQAGLHFALNPDLSADQFYSQFPLFQAQPERVPHSHGQPVLRARKASAHEYQVQSGNVITFSNLENRIVVEAQPDGNFVNLILSGTAPAADLNLPFIITPPAQDQVTGSVLYTDGGWINGFLRPEHQREGHPKIFFPNTQANRDIYREPHWLQFSNGNQRPIIGVPKEEGAFLHVSYDSYGMDSLTGIANEAHVAPFRAVAEPPIEDQPFQVSLSALNRNTPAPVPGTRFVFENGAFERTIVEVVHTPEGWTLKLAGPSIPFNPVLADAIPLPQTFSSQTPVDWNDEAWSHGLLRDVAQNKMFFENTEANRNLYPEHTPVLFGDGQVRTVIEQTQEGPFLHVTFDGPAINQELFAQDSNLTVIPPEAQ